MAKVRKPQAKKAPAKVGRKCSICTHADVGEINLLIAQPVSFRSISAQFKMGASSVGRHTKDCLNLDISALVAEQKVSQAVNVYEEFREQLVFAKALRQAAQEYLSHATDPLKLSITPKAHEIEVTYFDHNDMEVIGTGENATERPRKKTAQLSVILESLKDTGLHPEKHKVTTVDIRKFALDAINTTDTCIDKFAKIGGDYMKEKENPADNLSIARKVVHELLAQGKPKDEAVEFAASRYGVLEADLISA